MCKLKLLYTNPTNIDDFEQVNVRWAALNQT